MAAQVLSGTGNVSYTNSTGQNVRIVINYISTDNSSCTMTFQGVSCFIDWNSRLGKSVAWEASSATVRGERGYFNSNQGGNNAAAPTEVAISNGETFALTFSPSNSGQYNIIIIPEAG